MEDQQHLIAADEQILNKVYFIRNKKVMIDRDLAGLYGVSTRVLNQAVKRHLNRFPPDFMFQLSKEEMENWMSQFVTSKAISMGIRKLPLVFTEHGIAMLSSVLNSERAVEVNIRIIRLFVRMREVLMSNKDLMLKLQELESTVGKNNEDITTIFTVLKKLLQTPQKPRVKVGYRIRNQ